MPPVPNSFLALLDYHVELNEIFARHQEALLHWEVDEARLWLERAQRAYLEHMKEEEEVVLPVFRDRCGKIEGGAPEIFTGEHEKMRRFLREFEHTLDAMRGIGSNLARPIIALLDREATFKNLVDHHLLREQNILYPSLDRVTTIEERRAMLGRMARSPDSVPTGTAR